jgi:Ca2+-binding RTX toxin-like protein
LALFAALACAALAPPAALADPPPCSYTGPNDLTILGSSTPGTIELKGTIRAQSADFLVDISTCTSLDLDGGANVPEHVTLAPSLFSQTGLRGLTIVTGNGDDLLAVQDPRLVIGGGPVVWDAGGGTDVLAVAADTSWALSASGPGSVALRSASGGPLAASGVELADLAGGDGANRLDASAAAGLAHVVLRGGGGDDVFVPAPGPTFLDGGGGTDTVDFSHASRVALDLGAGVAVAPGGTDRLAGVENALGTAGPDILRGSDAANVLRGGGGDDVLYGGGGADLVDGGAGSDTALFDARGGVTARLTTGRASGQAPPGTFDVLQGIESLRGGPGPDVLVGDGDRNRLSGGGGNDVLVGGGGNDLLDGGPGVDTASFVDAGRGVTANLSTGVATGNGTDDLSGIESLAGSRFRDRLIGAAGRNVLSGAGGDDVLQGRGGDDAFVGGPGFDIVSFAASVVGVSANLELHRGRSGTARLSFAGVEGLVGSRFADLLVGDGGPNLLVGGRGRDVLRGMRGADMLRSRDGTPDVLDGGPGRDVAVADRRLDRRLRVEVLRAR